MTVAHSCVSMAGVKRFALLNVGIKIRCLTAWLNPNVLPVFPSRQRYAVCLLRYTATSSFSASCFRWRGLSVAASVLSNRTGKPLPCHKLSAIHVHRRIVATTSCGKYLSRLFIALHSPQLLNIPQSHLSASPVTKHRTSIGLRGTDFVYSCSVFSV